MSKFQPASFVSFSRKHVYTSVHEVLKKINRSQCLIYLSPSLSQTLHSSDNPSRMQFKSLFVVTSSLVGVALASPWFSTVTKTITATPPPATVTTISQCNTGISVSSFIMLWICYLRFEYRIPSVLQLGSIFQFTRRSIFVGSTRHRSSRYRCPCRSRMYSYLSHVRRIFQFTYNLFSHS